MLLNKTSIMNNDGSNLYDQKLNILYYIAGFVVRTISQKVFCISCKKSLLKKTNRIFILTDNLGNMNIQKYQQKS